MPLKVLNSFKVLSSACSFIWKLWVLINTWRRFCRTSFFQRKMFDTLVPGRIWLCAPYFERVLHGKICAKFRYEQGSFKVWVHWCCGLCKYIVGHTEISIFTCICLNLQKLFAKMQYFQRTLQVELNTLKEPCTFKGKCAVNAEICICNFLTGPLIKTTFEGRRTILKERAFQQCIAT